MTARSVADLVALYDRWGSHRYDEDLSQGDHALQTAALAADVDGSEPLVVAALLHDVGHLLDLDEHGGGGPPTTDLGHEARGARYLARLFPPSVTGPIALHVSAKRYLCALDPRYRAELSAGSVRSLELQGGPMSDAELAQFRGQPSFDAAVRLRRWDDQGKVDGLDVPPLASYHHLLERVAAK
ncbi:MAG: HD domain-containing protein [Actinomycetota bacterium]|nr:HD domain-containing protein [Actinomycetota bacterium]